MILDLKKYAILRNLSRVLGKQQGKEKSLHRFLGISEDGLVAAVINMAYNGRKGSVENLSGDQLAEALKSGKVTVTTIKTDPLPQTKGAKRFLDKAWADLEPLRGREDIYFNKHLRADAIEMAAARISGCQVRMRYLWRRSLQGGCTYDGMRCRYAECGTPKKNTYRIDSPKVGRPSKLKKFKGMLGGREIDEEVEQRFLRGIKNHVVGIKNKHKTLPDAFSYTLDDEFRKAVVVDGVEKLEYDSELPNYYQFRYFVRKTISRSKIKRSRKTAASYGTSDRPLLSESRSLKPKGPNNVFQIDSTDADVHIIADETDKENSRKLIGRPRLYIMRDVWSRLIVGWHLTLGNSSYEEAVCAIVSVLEDREKMCKEVGIPYDPEDWAPVALAGTIIADRQELVTHNSDLLLKRLNIFLTHPPGYRGDLKSLVEAGLGKTTNILWKLPGGIDRHAGKDERDYRENAIYSFAQIKGIILDEIIRINRETQKKMPVPPEAARRGIEKVPVILHRWGVKWLSGCGLAATLEEVRRKLLPLVKTASTRRDGVYISAAGVVEVYYRFDDNALPEELFERVKSRKLTAQYDPRCMDVVWVEHPDSHIMVPCFLSETKHPEYQSMTWAEGAEWQAWLNDTEGARKRTNLNKDGAARDRLRQATATARAHALSKKPMSRIGLSKGLKIARQAQHGKDLKSRIAVVTPKPAKYRW